MFFLTDLYDCPVGCGMGLIFLKQIGTDRIFLFCHACGTAYAGLPAEFQESMTSAETFAPNGISFPSREEVATAGLGAAIAEESADTDYYLDGLWQLLAYTAIKNGEYQQAVDITSKVISTWSMPPAIARAMQFEAISLLTGKTNK